jgi:hypothetical protein
MLRPSPLSTVTMGETSSRPRSPLPRTIVSASPEPVSSKEDNPKATQPKPTGDRNIQCAHLPHAALQVNRSDRTGVSSNFTKYDDACVHCSRTPPANSRCTTRAQVGPRAQTLPRLKSTSASGQTLLRSISASATCSPQIPQKATPSIVAHTPSNSRASSVTTSDGLPPLLSLALALISATKWCLMSPYTAELTYYSKAFCHIQCCVNHYDMGNLLVRWARVRDRALASALSRNRVGISQQQVQDPCSRPYSLMGLATPPHRTRPTPVLLASLLEAINRTIHGFMEEGEHFTIFTLTTILALASINTMDLGSFPLPISLYSLLQALRCK